MELQLISGHFEAMDAIGIITKMINVKIKFHEEKITSESTEEDIKMRERRIKQLQNELHEVRQFVDRENGKVRLNSTINLTY